MGRKDFVTCVQLLHALIQADDKITDEEASLLERVMAEMRFTEEEREAAREPLDIERGKEMIRGLSRPIRQGLLKTLVSGARADGHIDEREASFVANLGTSIGFTEEEIQAMLEG